MQNNIIAIHNIEQLTKEKDEFRPSEYQQKIIDTVKNEDCNILVDAKAGSGKTSTLKLIQNNLEQEEERCIILAFNKSIVAELQQKMPNWKMCYISTISSVGYKFLDEYVKMRGIQLYLRNGIKPKNMMYLKKDQIESRTKQLCRELYIESLKSEVEKVYAKTFSLKEIETIHKGIVNDIHSLCDAIRMHYSINLDENTNTISIKQDAINTRLKLDKYNYLEDYIFTNATLKSKLDLEKIVQYTIQQRINEFLNLDVINYNGQRYLGIEYIDMIFFPVILAKYIPIPKTIVPYTKYILLDESQDINVTQQKLLKRFNTGNTRYIFVGDKMQSIYAFAGADTKSIENLTKEYDLKKLPLNVCYRCPENVVRLAKTIVPDLEWNPLREDAGKVNIVKHNEFLRMVKPNETILCRKNSEVIELYTKLMFELDKDACLINKDLSSKIVTDITNSINNYIKYYREGFNIQVKLNEKLDEYRKSTGVLVTSKEYKDTQKQYIEDLVKETLENRPVNKITTPTIQYLQEYMEDYKLNGNYSLDDMESNSATEYYSKIEYLIHKYLKAKYKSINDSVEEFISYLNSLFAYKQEGINAIIISSVHQMKGGESDVVYIYNYPAFPYKFKDFGVEQLQQEVNLQYVALTRAKKTLNLVLMPEDNARFQNMNLNCIYTVKSALK